MRMCPNCRKANQPTRKYCIRCGKSLLKPVTESKKKPKSPVPELGTVTTEAKIKAEEEKAKSKAPPSPTTEDRWVRPSEVSRDRVRASARKEKKSELEKAREAFARAETAGLEEGRSGVVESRMLRASEVRELMEGASSTEAPDAAPETTPVRDSYSAAEESAPPPPAPKPEEDTKEQEILGAHSAFLDKQTTTEEQPVGTKEPRLPPSLSSEFSSSRYDQEDGETPSPEPDSKPVPKPPEEDVLEYEFEEEHQQEDVSICPDCGGIMHVDDFDYPSEVYSAMATARLKQARFFVVQGKVDEAFKILRLSTVLFKKAGDENGVSEVQHLADSLMRKSS